MPFKWSLMADVSSVIKGMTDVDQAIDQVADSLDALGKETGDTAEKAADKLASEFKTAYNKVQTEAKETGRRVGDDIERGAKKASRSTDTLKESARQNARETAASFDGSAQSIADGFQGAAAEAFDGFGPAGAAAGLAIAAGIGIASKALEDADEAAKATRANVQELGRTFATAASEAKGLADATADALTEKVKNPQGWVQQVFGGDDTDRLTLYTDNIKRAGLDVGEVMRAMQGDTAAYDKVTLEALRNVDNASSESALNFIDDIKKKGQAFLQARDWADAYAQTEVAAQQRAADAADSFSSALTDNLSVADEGLSEFVRGADVSTKEWNKKLKDSVKEGKLDVDAWAKEVKRRAGENKLVLDFTADVDTKLSPEALQNFEKLPTETQTQIAKAYGDGKGKKAQKILQTLEAEAKVTKVTVDTSEVKTAPVEIPSVVTSTGAVKGTTEAAAAAQSTANKADNVIEFKTRIDRDELQRQVTRAAASIHAPTIYVNVKTRKEVP